MTNAPDLDRNKFERSLSFSDLHKRPLVRCLSICVKDFFSKTTGSILIIFHMQISGEGKRKPYTFGPGHMSKMSKMSAISI